MADFLPSLRAFLFSRKAGAESSLCVPPPRNFSVCASVRQTATGVIFISVRAIVDEVVLGFETGERIKELREANNMAAKDLAKQMNIRTGSLKMIEFGVRKMTSYSYLRLHEIFGVSLHYIITGKELEEKAD